MPPAMLRVLLAAVAGLAMAGAFEPVRLFVLLPCGIALLLWVCREASLRSATAYGWVCGIVFFHVHIVWMRAVGTDAWLALSWFESLYFALLGPALTLMSRLRAWPLWSALVWVAVEALRGAWPMSGFTWGRASFATIDTPFAAWVPWLGSTGVSLLVVLVSAGLLWAALVARSRPRRVVVVLVVAVVLLALPQVAQPPRDTRGSMRIAVVQGDVPGEGNDLIAHHREVTASHVDATIDLGARVRTGAVERPDLVVWPENSTAVDPFLDREVRDQIRQAVAAVNAPVLVGGMVDRGEEQVLNQGIVVDPARGAGDRYTKRHPVPFGEYIPYRERLGRWNFRGLRLVPRDMMSGTRATPLRVDGVLIADAICFDVAYDDAIGEQVRAGADLLVVQTSNAMFIHTSQIDQQFAISRLRALETGRYVVVAAVNGRSGVIGPDGEVRSAIPPRTRSVLVDEVQLTTTVPPAVRIGPWLGRACVLLAPIGLWFGGLAYRRRVGETAPQERGDSA